MTRNLLPHPVTGRQFPSPVPPGTGWPGDLASATTTVATTSVDVLRLADSFDDVAELCGAMSVCRACPRLVEWREDVADVIGLAPAANGGNRTGRIFTGDRSGDWLFASLHRVGLAARERSDHAGDGQRLVGARMVATVRCAPPGNKPTVQERDTCAPWLLKEISLVSDSVRAIVCLGLYGWDATLRTFRSLGYDVQRPKPKFGHGAEAVITSPTGQQVTVLASYHPSQQNTFTGKLTEPMLDAVLGRAAALGARPGARG